ncbi:ATP-dependent protease La [Vulgatibacter incomptus]|uniref:Lon protease n=1 Tax=Vulgatibacter incomptus TaxID=1391653 RepID=A0A0K1PF18_9BACT|nr:ATP-dependent protease La [Vulgatibacter incomptus]
MPVLPIRGAVVFPLAVVPISVGQERSIQLAEEVMHTDRLIAIVAQQNEDASPAEPDDLYRVGTSAVVRQFHRTDAGTIQLVVQGLGRIRIDDYVSTEPYMVAKVSDAPEEGGAGKTELEALTRTAQDLFSQLAQHTPELPDELALAMRAFDDPLQVTYLLATTVPLPTPVRQDLLELDSVAVRLQHLVELIQKDLAVRELEQKIVDETKVRISDTQREYVLRERIRAIQEELGESGGEGQQLRKKIEEAGLNEEAKREADRELSRLEGIPEVSPEHGMIRTWLEWIAAMPWKKTTGGPIDLDEARMILDRDHYDLDKIKERLVDYLAVKKLRDERRVGAEPSTAREKGGEPSGKPTGKPAEKPAGKPVGKPNGTTGTVIATGAPTEGAEAAVERAAKAAMEAAKESAKGSAKEEAKAAAKEAEEKAEKKAAKEAGEEAPSDEKPGKKPAKGPEKKEGFVPTALQRPLRREPILCFVGPPGTGKTSLGQSIARALGRKFVHASLGGIHDEAEIRGHRRTYIGALPGRIVQSLRRVGVSDPVFMLDEVDKLSASFQGDPSAALLEVLDPDQNSEFVDTYLGVPVNLSRVLFICTANTTEPIPPALLDRMEVLRLAGYTEEEKVQIAVRHLLPLELRSNGLDAEEVELDDDVLRKVIREYTREAGVRNLERELATILRKSARRIGEGKPTPIAVLPDELHDFLGPRRFFDELAERVDRPGVATGLSWTPAGGQTLFVEATMMPGRKEKLILTGKLGSVLKESAQAALSWLRSNATRLGIEPDIFLRRIVHVHVPSGAIAKDGPSAGVAILAALVSLVSGVALRPDVAMTGEITLRGKVLPVGGIRDKVLAAHRAGIPVVILPRRSEGALEELPKEVRDDMHIVLVDTVDEVLAEALPAVKAEEEAEGEEAAPDLM